MLLVSNEVEWDDCENINQQPARGIVLRNSAAVLYYGKVLIVEGRVEVENDVNQEEEVNRVVGDDPADRIILFKGYSVRRYYARHNEQ